jgi:DNA repair protein RecN (Recombination protein N)
MLEELSITNIALIEQVTVGFATGMNCLTGETGAGKSILAGALGLVRGDKGDIELIRTGTEEAVVGARFLCPERADLAEWLAERGLAPEDGRLFIRRVIRRSGKGSIFVQGQPLPLKELVDLAAMLLDMHGQHEHQGLFVVDNHRLMLDRFGGLQDRAEVLYRGFAELATQMKQREKLQENARDRLRQQEYLEYAVREIAEAALVPGQDAELERERKIVTQSERLFSLCAKAHEQLSAAEGGALGFVYTAKQETAEAAGIDPTLAELAGRLENLYYELEDVSATLQGWQDRSVFDPGRLDEIEDRLNLLSKLKKKYGPDIESVIRFGQESRTELDQLVNYDQNLEALNASIKEREVAVLAEAQELSRLRRQAAARIKQAVETGLKSLSMAKTVFEVEFRQKSSERGTPVCGPYGIDNIEFLLSSNPGEPLKPLRSVASGGEISRIMLAIKAALADSDDVSCLVFDEVDTGIGGEVAVALGEHLHRLSETKQILAITHLASIAVRADNHIKVEKELRDGRTITRAGAVTGDQRVAEVARMLSGDPHGDASRGHALELLRKAHPV